MKNLKLLAVILCIGCTQPAPPEDNRLKQVIMEAKKVNDYQTAISATYELLVTDTNEISYYDSLAVYYYKLGNYNSALKTCETLLEYRTNDTILLIAAKSSVALNKLDDLVLYANAIIGLNPESLEWRYELAKAYFNLNNAYQAQKALRELIGMGQSKIEGTEMVIDGRSFRVNYYSAAYNLLGIIQADAGRKNDAIKLFQESLKFAPDFPLPRKNIEVLSTE